MTKTAIQIAHRWWEIAQLLHLSAIFFDKMKKVGEGQVRGCSSQNRLETAKVCDSHSANDLQIPMGKWKI
jgi:hypothetical protein